jgi:hypothetical protein
LSTDLLADMKETVAIVKRKATHKKVNTRIIDLLSYLKKRKRENICFAFPDLNLQHRKNGFPLKKWVSHSFTQPLLSLNPKCNIILSSQNSGQ